MVATAAAEKLFIGRRRPVRNWTTHTATLAINDTDGNAARYQACFCAENYICSQENQQKLLPPELHFSTPTCTKSSVGCGFAPDPTVELTALPQAP